MNEQIKTLHSAWNRATGQDIRMGLCAYSIEFAWHEFIQSGHTEAELLTVVNYLKAEIKKGERKPAALRFSNLICDGLRFSEELELARGAMKRKTPETPLGRAMRQMRPVVAQVTPEAARVTAVPVGDLIANLRKAAGMTI